MHNFKLEPGLEQYRAERFARSSQVHVRRLALHGQICLIYRMLHGGELGNNGGCNVERDVREHFVAVGWERMAQEIAGNYGHIRVIAKRPLEQVGQMRIFFDGDDLAETSRELSGDHALAGTNFIDRTVISEVETVEEIGD